jgi:hypothetical protein
MKSQIKRLEICLTFILIDEPSRFANGTVLLSRFGSILFLTHLQSLEKSWNSPVALQNFSPRNYIKVLYDDQDLRRVRRADKIYRKVTAKEFFFTFRE